MNPSSTPRSSLGRRIAKWTARVVLGLLLLVAVGLLLAYGVTRHDMTASFGVPESGLLHGPFLSDSALVAAGERLVTIRGCNDCHDADLGGKVMIDDPMLGRVVAANLTSEGNTRAFAMEDWDRAVRHGVRPDGTGYLVMPSNEFHVLSDEDLTAIVAYLRQLPGVERDLPSNQVRPLGYVLNAAGMLPLVPAAKIDHAAPRAAVPPAGPTPEYGAYVASGCVGCHGQNYAGGMVPGVGIMASNLTPDAETGLGTWSEADFAHALRTGTRPDGTALDPFMPIAMTSKLTDTEVAAIWAYLQTLPAVRNEKG